MQDAVPEDQQKEELMESISKGNFSLRILYEQLANIQKMGPVSQVMSMIPGMSNSDIFGQVCHPVIASHRRGLVFFFLNILVPSPVLKCSVMQAHRADCQNKRGHKLSVMHSKLIL